MTDVLVTANYSALSYQLAGQHKCCTETNQHHHHQAAYAGGLSKLTTKRCSFNIMCACGKSHHLLKRISECLRIDVSHNCYDNDDESLRMMTTLMTDNTWN